MPHNFRITNSEITRLTARATALASIDRVDQYSANCGHAAAHVTKVVGAIQRGARVLDGKAKETLTIGRPRSSQTAGFCSGQIAGFGPYPPGPQKRFGIRFRHVDRAVACHGEVDAGKQLDIEMPRGARRRTGGPGICPLRSSSARCR